ncbi:MAG: 30S ribosomal protein S13 [Candidatus Aenigmarchaeota archaeon]|nr:30S ribosomal protein S13 [Candidatus Aenigmarchaeota archaeon]
MERAKTSGELRGIVRIAGVDLKGEKKVYVSLQRIRGVGHSIANAICKIANIDRNRKVGTLTEEEVEKIEMILENLNKYVPAWLLNRPADPESGQNRHLFSADVKFTQDQDIKKMIEKRCYKGVRHALGLPVRGQRTRSSFRKAGPVGVVRKKKQPGKK